MAKKNLFTLNKIIAYLIILLLVIVLGILIYTYGGGLQLLVSSTTTRTDAFRDYDVVKKFGNGIFNVEFRDLITSTGGLNKSYYRYDVTISAVDKKSAEDMIDTRKQVIAIINQVMSTFPVEETNTEAERSRVKRIIQQEVSGHYPNIAIKDVYFTNFLHD
jgi:flagellar basal body-associated protein FliL